MERILRKFRRDGFAGLARGLKCRTAQVLCRNMPSVSFFHRKPRVVYVETTGLCNLKCMTCCRGKRSLGHMETSLFHDIVDELAEIGDVCTVLHFSGEPLLHPQFGELIEYIMGKRGRLYDVGFNTNGTLLNEAASQLFVDLGVDWVTVSLDGVGKVNDRIRQGSNYANVERNIARLLEIRGNRTRPRVTINSVLSTQTDEEFEAIWKAWQGKVDAVNFTTCCEENTYRRLNLDRALKFGHGYKPDSNCIYPFKQMVILWNGDVTFCNHDLTGRGIVGNVKDYGVMGVWTGDVMVEARKHFLAKKFGPQEICGQCCKFEKKEG